MGNPLTYCKGVVKNPLTNGRLATKHTPSNQWAVSPNHLPSPLLLKLLCIFSQFTMVSQWVLFSLILYFYFLLQANLSKAEVDGKYGWLWWGCCCVRSSYTLDFPQTCVRCLRSSISGTATMAWWMLVVCPTSFDALGSTPPTPVVSGMELWLWQVGFNYPSFLPKMRFNPMAFDYIFEWVSFTPSRNVDSLCSNEL